MLVDRARRGDRDAFGVLAAGAVDRLYAIARLLLRDTQLAEDATQDALVRAWRDLRTLRDPGGFVGMMVVAPDGRLWSTGDAEDRGTVIGFSDGTTWTDVYTHEGDGGPGPGTPIKVAPDGTIWVRTRDGFIVVDPEAALVAP